MQKTLAQSVTINGIGLHSGTEVCMTVKPGQPDTGIVFVRTDEQCHSCPLGLCR